MTIQYYAGIKFNANSSEFKSEPTNSAQDAIDVCKVGSASGKYYEIGFYVVKDGQTIRIPYSEIEKEKGSLESKLNKIIERK